MQVLPPIFKAKLAVPQPTGVPVIVYRRLLDPLTNDPGSSVAVRPVTPVDVTV
jgi:hypothetical protein